MNHALFSPEALAHFKKFAITAQNDRAARRTSRSSNPAGAFDVSTPALKRAVARENLALDGTEGTPDPDAIRAILAAFEASHGADAATALMKCCHQNWPGSVGEMPGEDGPDWPHSEANGEASEAQDEDNDFSIEGQFRKAAAAAKDTTGGGPVPFKGEPLRGGKMVAQDRALKRAQRDRTSYLSDFPSARRIGGDINDVRTRERPMTAQDAALHMAGVADFEQMFPDAARIRVI